MDKYNDGLHIKYIRYIAGLTAARNMGIRECKGDVILFLDDDVVLDREYIYNILSTFDIYGKDIGAVSGNIVSDEIRCNRSVNLAKYSIYTKTRNLIFNMFFLSAWGNGKFQPSGFPTFPIGKKKTLFIECCQGANMAFRKEVLDNFKFDENLKGYCFMEDSDISYRIAQKYKIVYTPYAKLWHNVSVTSRDSDYGRMKMYVENHYYLFNKNFPQKFYNKFAFWISIIGLFIITVLELKTGGLHGLFNGLKTTMSKRKGIVLS